MFKQYMLCPLVVSPVGENEFGLIERAAVSEVFPTIALDLTRSRRLYVDDLSDPDIDAADVEGAAGLQRYHVPRVAQLLEQ